MSGACVALALATTLDIAAVRRLHDYGDLDDAGVVHAFEQMRVQQFGRLQLPAYLIAITQAAAVVDDAGAMHIVQSGADPDEAALLENLISQLPARIETLVGWDGSDAAFIGARAFRHELPVGDTLPADAAFALADHLAPLAHDDASDATDREAEIVRLIGLPDNADGFANRGDTVVATAINRYRLWLRWQVCRGAVTPGARAARERGLTVARENTDTTSV